jgi:hypothetical protein
MASREVLFSRTLSAGGNWKVTPHSASFSSKWPVMMLRRDISDEPISSRTTLNLPAMIGAAWRTFSLVSSAENSSFSATLEMTDIKCDLPVP